MARARARPVADTVREHCPKQRAGQHARLLRPRQDRELSLAQILTHGVGFCLRASAYESAGVQVIENTPQEIRDLVVEMSERLNGTWQSHDDDDVLQKRFWELFPKNALDAHRRRPLHGDTRARFGACFLRNNREWLQ